MSVMARDALGRDLPQFFVFGRRVDNQGRKHLLKNVAVLLEEEAEELLGVVRHQVDFEAVVYTGLLDRPGTDLQADDLLQRQHVDATQVEIRSALTRLREDDDLTDRQVQDAIQKWEMLEQIAREVNPTEQVRSLARRLPAQYQLRTLDAFQLAAALAWSQENPRRRPFICFDDRLARAAESAGFAVHGLRSKQS